MKTPYIALMLIAYLMLSGRGFSRDALEIISGHVHDSLGASSPEAVAVMQEAEIILRGDHRLKQNIESEAGRIATHDALIWGAARSVTFNQSAFSEKFPNLYKYGCVLLVTPDFHQARRAIYQLRGGAGYPEPRMLFGDSETPLIATIERVEKWNDDEGVADWIGEYSFENTDKGPYLLTTSIGRETTGASSIRHVLGWVRIDANRLVPVRFEAFDVPIGQQRQSAHLKITALPALSAKLPPPENTSLKSKTSEVKLKTANKAETPPTPWNIIVLLIVVVLGLLWLSLKGRK